VTFRRVAAVAAMLVILLPLTSRSEQKLQFSGDMRGRLETFRFSQDETGSKKDSRGRLRYRLRLNAGAAINDYLGFDLRVGTGASDSRSGNVTLGGMVDFGPDAFGIRRAYLTVNPYAGGKLPGDNGNWAFQFGRVPNPFLWKNGEDKMLWDGDINLSGASTTFDIAAGGAGSVFVNAGYFVLEEKSSDKDAFMASAQAGVTGGSSSVKAGARGTFYRFDRLTKAFIDRGVDGTGGATSGGGNIADGLTGDPNGGQMNVVEGQAFLGAAQDGTWPIVAFGGASYNASAKASVASPGVGKDANAFNAGIHVGSKKKVAQFGASYYYIEANAFPSQFIDSDLLDGVTNRDGFVVTFAKSLTKVADLGLTLLYSDAIQDSPAYATSVQDSERFRTQFDLAVKF
jgi:hypothetical protein